MACFHLLAVSLENSMSSMMMMSASVIAVLAAFLVPMDDPVAVVLFPF
jgi:hypothetical protein